MSATLRGPAAVAIVLTLGLAAHAESPDAVDLLNKAIGYHGGRAAIEAMPHVKAKGTLEPGGWLAGRTLDLVAYERADGARRTEVTFEFRGRKGTSIELYDGVMCKRRFSSSWDDLPLDENRERVAHRISILVDALAKSPETLGDGREADVDVWRVEIPDGRGTAVLSLAKDDGRLVALEYPGIQAEGMGTKKEVQKKIVHREFKRVGGVALPSDIEILVDGTFDARLRFETMEPIKSWDDDWLRVPDPTRRFVPPEELAY